MGPIGNLKWSIEVQNWPLKFNLPLPSPMNSIQYYYTEYDTQNVNKGPKLVKATYGFSD